MQPVFHAGSTSVGDTRDLLNALLEPCAEYIALGWSLERVILVWRASSQEIPIPAAPTRRLPVSSRRARSGLARARQRAHKAFRAGAWEATVGFVRSGGRRFSTRVLIAPVRDARGRPTGFVVVSQHYEGSPRRCAGSRRRAVCVARCVASSHEAGIAIRARLVPNRRSSGGERPATDGQTDGTAVRDQGAPPRRGRAH